MHHQLTLADGTGNLPLLVDLVTRTWSEKPLIYVVHAYESDGVYLEPFPVSFSGNVALRVATREELVAAN
ncbi:hypothetical protein NQ228_25190, partial [Escherichia coli]|nr:hypothetical protein [Escherichia coli]